MKTKEQIEKRQESYRGTYVELCELVRILKEQGSLEEADKTYSLAVGILDLIRELDWVLED